jgi:uncharacterized protein
MNRPVHFEIHADNPERAVAFYSALFGWKFTKWDGPMPYWMIKTGDGMGIDGGMVPRRGPPPIEGQPVNACPVTMNVASCDEAVSAITANGGTIALPRMAIPGVGWLAYGKDTEGNIFGVMQNDPAAK